MTEPLRADVVSKCPRCTRREELERMYFCTACSSIRCSRCILEEIDSWFCPQCMESVPQSDAALYANRCVRCFACPVCDSAVSATLSDGGHALACKFCSWRSVQLSGQGEAAGTAAQAEMERLVAHFRALQAAADKEQEAFSRGRRRLLNLSMPAWSSRRLEPVSIAEVEQRLQEKEARWLLRDCRSSPPPELPPYSTRAELQEPLTLPTMKQMLASPLNPPRRAEEVRAQRRKLATRRAKRCAECERYVVKPELNPSSAHFQIRNTALLFVPRVTVLRAERGPEALEGELLLTSRLERAAAVSLAPLDPGLDLPAALHLAIGPYSVLEDFEEGDAGPLPGAPPGTHPAPRGPAGGCPTARSRPSGWPCPAGRPREPSWRGGCGWRCGRRARAAASSQTPSSCRSESPRDREPHRPTAW
eukprot:tig00000444_g817.t1